MNGVCVCVFFTCVLIGQETTKTASRMCYFFHPSSLSNTRVCRVSLSPPSPSASRREKFRVWAQQRVSRPRNPQRCHHGAGSRGGGGGACSHWGASAAKEVDVKFAVVVEVLVDWPEGYRRIFVLSYVSAKRAEPYSLCVCIYCLCACWFD